MKELRKEFSKYAIPSVIGMMVSALYVVVDGIFVGQGVGPSALASVNVALPMMSLMTALTMMITMGGAALTSIKFGENKQKEGNNIFLQAIILVGVISAIFSLIAVIMPDTLAKLLGASPELLEGTAVYLKYYLIFGIFFCGSLSLSAFVRNDGNPNLAMIALIVGAISNIVLDYLFIFEFNMGIKGAAIASGLGQVASLLILSIHFIMKKGTLRLYVPKFTIQEVKRVFKTGMPEFIVQVSPAVSTLMFNFVILDRIGEGGVAAFSIINYLVTILVALFIGVAQGVQPLISYNYGKQDYDKVEKLFKLGRKTNFMAAVLVYLVLFLFGEYIARIFNNDSELVALTYEAMKIYMFSFIIASINIITVSYYQATENPKTANLISAMRGMVFTVGCILILPSILGNFGIWASIVLAEILTLVFIKYVQGNNVKKEACVAK